MQGLLAAHMLAMEFNRVVCIDPAYKQFLQAFDPIDPDVVRYCPNVLESFDAKVLQTEGNFIQLINFWRPPDECQLKERLESDTRVILIEGNTYPRWSEVPQENFFFKYYRAKQELLNILPYSEPPKTVVHLRAPDSVKDQREGVGDDSLRVLFTEMITTKDVFVVCNRVKWFELAEEFGLQHSPWESVSHSALHASWGTRSKSKETHIGVIRRVDMHGQKFDPVENMQMWADWYTILTAKKVFHTHSDFSGSAVHWQRIDSKRITGDGTKLKFSPETWQTDVELPRLVDRIHTSYSDSDPYQLSLCGAYPDRYDKNMLAIDNDEPPPEVGKIRVVGVYIHHRPRLNETTTTVLPADQNHNHDNNS